MEPVTVTQVNEYIAKRLREDLNLKNIAIKGEISGLSRSGSNIYLTLKDHDSQLRCNIWSNYVDAIDPDVLEDGREIIVLGDISPYVKGGYYSLSIKNAKAVGIGELMAEFNRVKDKLQKEGLFDQAHKRPLPGFPERIGIITSESGAAVQDIRKIIMQKNDYVDLLIFPTYVQGNLAADSIISNIEAANRINSDGKKIDVLIVGRGGGSPEDLAAFNDEGVARAIYESVIPVISAVGHESDFSISDFVADVRAETPTAAAEISVPDTSELREEIDYDRGYLLESMYSKIAFEKSAYEIARRDLMSALGSRIREYELIIENELTKLKENDPENILQKGYAYVTDLGGYNVADVTDIKIGSEYKIRLSNGSFEATVTDVDVD